MFDRQRSRARRRASSGLVAVGLLASSFAGTVLESPAAGAASLGYSCSAPGGWAALNTPENGVDTMVRDSLVNSLNNSALPVTLNYSGPTTGYQGQSITRKWDMNVSIDIPNSQTFDLTLEMDPGAGSTTVNATNATPATSSVAIPNMPIVSHVIPVGGTATYAFPATLSSTAVLGSGNAGFTPGSFTLPMMVRVWYFAWYGVTGTMVCNPTTTPQVGSVTVDKADGSFHALSPKRILDTQTSTCVSGSTGRNLTVAGVNGVPSNAATVAINVTAMKATGTGSVVLSPTGTTRTTSATVNYLKATTVANLGIAKVGSSGRVNLYATAGCPHLQVDIVGWYEGGTPATGGFAAVTPKRLLDTRPGTCVSGTSGRSLTVTGVGGVPSTAAAVAVVVTATGATGSGNLLVFPKGSTRPNASNLSFRKSQTVSTTVLAKVGTSGQITLYATGGCPDVLVDVVGWFNSTSAANGGLSSRSPTRILDTRSAAPCVSGTSGRTVTVAGVSSIPSTASAVALAVTAIGPTTNGSLVAYPSGVARPTASSLSYTSSVSTAALVIAKVGTGGRVTFYASGGCPNITVDVLGYYSKTPF